MKKTVLVLSALVAVAVSPLTSVAVQEASKATPSPAPAAAAPAEKSTRSAGQPMAAADPAKRPKTLKMFVGEFRALDLDKKTLTFATEDGKTYTVAAQVPTTQDTLDRAARLAEVLKPGDKIRMLCRINQQEEPTQILSLHMTSSTAPLQYR